MKWVRDLVALAKHDHLVYKIHMANPDIFNVGNDGDDVHGVLIQMQPADGWRAVVRHPLRKGVHRTLGLACFALVELIDPAAIKRAAETGLPPLPTRVVRPMVADEFGEIVDVASLDDDEFVCLVPPGGDVALQLAYVEDIERAEAAAGR